jgi:hypothetical protein
MGISRRLEKCKWMIRWVLAEILITGGPIRPRKGATRGLRHRRGGRVVGGGFSRFGNLVAPPINLRTSRATVAQN